MVNIAIKSISLKESINKTTSSDIGRNIVNNKEVNKAVGK